MVRGALTASFLSGLPPEMHASASALPGLEALLASRLADARAAWAGVSVPDEIVVRHAAAVLSADRPIAEALDAIRFDGLYLAAGCAAGIAEAVASLSGVLDTQADLVLARMRLDASAVQELKQRLRVHLFVASGNAPARIASYTGRGDLRSWLGVCATRMAITSLREQKKDRVANDDELLDLTAPADDPETQYLKETYGEAFRASFAEALRALTSRERAVLRYSFIEDLSIDQIGVLCGVSRATAARWIRSAQEQLLEHTRVVLARKVGIATDDVNSILRLVQSRLDLAASAARAGLESMLASRK